MQQEHLDGFLKTGKELFITGLTQDFDPKLEPAADDLVKNIESEKDDIQEKNYKEIDLPVSATGEESVFPCNKCDYTSSYLHNLTKHVNAKHTQIMHGCNFCEYKSSWKQQLKEHIRSIHEGKRMISRQQPSAA